MDGIVFSGIVPGVFPDAEPISLVSGSVLLLNADESVRFAWREVEGANCYRLTVLSAQDTSLMIQKKRKTTMWIPLFIDTNWSGTIIAPNAKIIMGQTHKKELYGQFYANEIVVHQYSYLEYVPFDPIWVNLECVIKEKPLMLKEDGV